MTDSFMKSIIPQRVSVIIPSYNEERDIEKCLISLQQQTYPDLEIIVIDDGSVDATLENIKKFSVKLLNQSHQGPAIARNLGASKAKGEILVFVDADMTFDKDFIKNLIKPILDKKTIGTFSKGEYVANMDNVWSRCWNLNKGLTKNKMLPDNYPDTQPVFRAILKSKFDEVNGFDSVGYNDDWTLSQKLRIQAINAPGAIFYHRNPDNLTEIWQHALWVGKRRYKLRLAALFRSSFPMSLIVGIFKSFVYLTPQFLIFKVVYDFAIFISIFKSFLPGYTVVK